MKNPDYFNHEDFADYYGYTQRHKRAVDYLNNKPGISPGLRRLLIIALLALVGVLTAYLAG